MRKGLRVRSTYAKGLWHGEPWVFSKAIIDSTINLKPGEFIDVRSRDGKVIGQGFFNPMSDVMIRLVRWWNEKVPSTEVELLIARLNEAFALRQKLGIPNAATNVFRLVNSEGDRLSGLTVDCLGDIAVVQYSALWVAERGPMIKQMILDLGIVDKVVFRVSRAMKEKEHLDEIDISLSDEVVESRVMEHGLKYLVDPRAGQKTGFYIDQRDNRIMMRAFAKDAKCLDACSFTGGFSMNMAAGGASSVTAIDSSEPALRILEENAKANGFENIDWIAGDAQDVMDHMDNRYDIVVLDPPKLARRMDSFNMARAKYEYWNASALRRVERGGLLFTCSCSSIMKRDTFIATLKDAAHRAKRQIRLIKVVHAGGDHPIVPAYPRGEYLKCLLLEVR